MDEIAKLDCDGYAIGGLAVGEPTQTMYDIIEAVEPHMPKEKPRYLMGVGTPSNIIEGVARGVDFFDCVMPDVYKRQAPGRPLRGRTRPGSDRPSSNTREVGNPFLQEAKRFKRGLRK